MRDIKIYLNTNTTKLQAFIHVVGAACFFYKGYNIHINQDFYLFWLGLYMGFGVLLSLAAIFQVIVNFRSRHLAAILNIMTGVVLVVESLIRITDSTKKFYAVNLLAGLTFILVGVFEDRINKVPYIIFSKNNIHGRRSLVSYFNHSWENISDINFKRNQIKIFTKSGREIKYQVARQSVGGILIKSAEYACQQRLEQISKLATRQMAES